MEGEGKLKLVTNDIERAIRGYEYNNGDYTSYGALSSGKAMAPHLEGWPDNCIKSWQNRGSIRGLFYYKETI